jgi:hypothetical protein
LVSKHTYRCPLPARWDPAISATQRNRNDQEYSKAPTAPIAWGLGLGRILEARTAASASRQTTTVGPSPTGARRVVASFRDHQGRRMRTGIRGRHASGRDGGEDLDSPSPVRRSALATLLLYVTSSTPLLLLAESEVEVKQIQSNPRLNPTRVCRHPRVRSPGWTAQITTRGVS